MRVGKQYLGQMVELQWSDPSGARVMKHDLRSGLDALAHWKERGVIDDISDGVVRLLQSEATNAGGTEPNEFIVSYIPESIITDIVVFRPIPAAPPVPTIMPAQAINGEA